MAGEAGNLQDDIFLAGQAVFLLWCIARFTTCQIYHMHTLYSMSYEWVHICMPVVVSYDSKAENSIFRSRILDGLNPEDIYDHV